MRSEKKKDFLERYSKLSRMKEDWVKTYSASLIQKDGRAHLLVDLTKGEVMSPYSDGRMISPDLMDYIEKEASFIQLEEPLSIDFKVQDKDAETNRTIARQVQEQFLFKFCLTKKKRFKVLKDTFFFLIVGILFCLVYIILSVFASRAEGNTRLYLTILSEVIDIVYWVFIWEATDKFFFERRGVQEELFRFTQLASAEINFLE